MKILSIPSDFNDAFLNKWIVEVWEDGEIQEYGAPIELHMKDWVKLRGVTYRKSLYEFRVEEL